MTDDQHGEGTPRGGSRWDPLPQGEYDDGATAFVELPEGGVDALLAADSPLAAPGHGYVPPQITVDPATTAGTDPAATSAWPVPGAPVDGAQWHDPHALHQQQGHEAGEQSYGSDAPYGSGTPYGTDAGAGQHGGDDRFTYNPGATGQWNFEDATAAEAAPGHDVTGQWSIPVAGGDLPDESGEFTTSSLVEQWGGNPPATLPGGASAPWATQAAGEPWGQQDTAGHDQAGPGYPHGHEHEQGHGHAQPGLAGPPSAYAPDQSAPARSSRLRGPCLRRRTPRTCRGRTRAPATHPGPGGSAMRRSRPELPATDRSRPASSTTGRSRPASPIAVRNPPSSPIAEPTAGEPSVFTDRAERRLHRCGAEPSGVPGHAPEPSGAAGHPAEHPASAAHAPEQPASAQVYGTHAEPAGVPGGRPGRLTGRSRAR